MLCSVYKSAKKAQTYLFINKRDDFSEVPEALMKMFGKPEMVTVLNLATKVKLGFADLTKVKEISKSLISFTVFSTIFSVNICS